MSDFRVSAWTTCMLSRVYGSRVCLYTGSMCFDTEDEAMPTFCPMPFEPSTYTECCTNENGLTRCCKPTNSSSVYNVFAVACERQPIAAGGPFTLGGLANQGRARAGHEKFGVYPSTPKNRPNVGAIKHFS